MNFCNSGKVENLLYSLENRVKFWPISHCWYTYLKTVEASLNDVHYSSLSR
jgi:hypothetical protein